MQCWACGLAPDDQLHAPFSHFLKPEQGRRLRMKTQRPRHRFGKLSNIFTRRQSHVANNIVCAALYVRCITGLPYRGGYVFDQYKGQRIAAGVPTDAMLLVVEKSQAAMRSYSAFADDQTRAQYA